MANKLITSASFSGPKFSYFSMDHPDLVSMKFGDCVPVYWDFLNPADKAIFDMSQVVRVSPMLQPILSQIDITVDAYAVRLRSLGMSERNPWQYEDFFNANKNLDGRFFLPRSKASDIGASVNFRLGSLYDYLGFPTLDALRRDFRRYVSRHPFLTTSALGVCKIKTLQDLPPGHLYAPMGSSPLLQPLLGYSSASDGDGESNPASSLISVYYTYSNSMYGASVDGYPSPIMPLALYALLLCVGVDPSSLSLYDEISGYLSPAPWCYSSVEDYEHFEVFAGVFDALESKSLPDFLFEHYRLDWQSVEQAWFDFAFKNWVIRSVSMIDESTFGDSSFFEDVITPIFVDNVGTVTNPIQNASGIGDSDLVPAVDPTLSYNDNFPEGDIYAPLYPAVAYWKIMADWYLNTGLFNPDEWFLSKVFIDGDKDSGYNLPSLFGDCYKRNWSPDYFTSAFDSAQRGLAVGIPADGTIPDLRNANALQKFKERLLFAGQKFRDVIYSIFGIKMSSAIADMSEALGRWVNPVNIDSTLQTSESSAKSPLASYAGTGLSFGHKKHILKYTAEEPTVIMFIASIRPKYAIYYQGFPKKLRRNYLMDYAIPGFSNVGEQMISNRELYCDLGAPESEVFGFTRRFADFMSAPGECHGDFKDFLDTWHLARQFDESPLLNQNFLEVNPVSDNLNRIFATTSDSVDKFYCNFFFNGGIVRSIPKRLYYDL